MGKIEFGRNVIRLPLARRAFPGPVVKAEAVLVPTAKRIFEETGMPKSSLQAMRNSRNARAGKAVNGTGGTSHSRSSGPAITVSARRKSSTERANGPSATADKSLGKVV